MTSLAITLAAAGAVCFAVAAWLQQAAVRADGPRLSRLLRAPRWLSGFGLTGLGAGLHACALGLAPLTVVQPVGAVAIALTTVLAVRGRLTRSTWLAVIASTAGVGVFVLLAAQRAAMPALSSGAEARAGALTAVGVVALGAVGAVTTGRVRCLAYAAAAGMAYGLVSVYVHALAIGHLHVVAALGLVAALPVGMWFVQHAYAAGPPQVVIACQTVIDPMVGVGVGLGLFGEAAGLPRSAALALVVCATVAVTGVVLLAREHVRPQWSRS
ncbi:hypothetical protein [Kutzneria buriramensis]|uniref:Magnesium transporter NIPA n=1 Tax=Kutzneria buriramensis TaxID=1045776 RepID=A0A3E0GUC9_9PSEU|nr:hypothetical protein [Kutzneria buriramensis]REH27684.1 hypothetical protein BCF44_12972 [Kutzneria buriramensis]